jgi:hypothetical protein
MLEDKACNIRKIKEDAMNYLKPFITLTLVLTTSIAFGASGGDTEGNGFLVWLFLGFGALIVVFQTVPGLLMLYAMVKGALLPAEKKESGKA